MRYYSTQRPFGPGTFPRKDGTEAITNYDAPTYIEEIGRKAWGHIDYEKPLTDKEVRDYELVPSTTVTEEFVMPEKKSDIVRRLIAAGEYKKALRIAKGFRLGISKADREAMRLGYECMVSPDFYRQIGKDVRAEINRGVDVLVRIYGGQSTEEV